MAYFVASTDRLHLLKTVFARRHKARALVWKSIEYNEVFIFMSGSS